MSKIAVLVALSVLISSVGCKRKIAGRQPHAPTATTSVLAGDHRFACSSQRRVGCRGVFPVRPAAGSTAAVLSSGEEAFRARIESLRRARRSIRIQALIFRGDESGLLIADLLKQKRKAGLDVRVIVDAVSNLSWQTQWMYFDLKQHGIEVEGYEALYLQWLTAEVKPTDPLRPNKRFHEKMWVVDGEDPEHGLAIVGGLNIANEYFRVDSTPINRWSDQDVVLRGAVVADVVRAFERNYDSFKENKRRLRPLNNPDNVWRLARGVLDRIAAVKVPDWRNEAIEAGIKRALARQASLEFLPARARFLQSRPRLGETHIEQAYLNMVDRAKKRVLIANAYFVPSRKLADSLRRAARRGVRVTIITNSPATNDIRSVAVVSRATYRDLLAVNRQRAATGRIELFEWRGPPVKEGTLHAKFAVFDAREAVVGSFNLDPRSARLNSESAVALGGPVAARLERLFLEHYLPLADQIGWEQASKFHDPPELGKRFELLFNLPLKDWL